MKNINDLFSALSAHSVGLVSGTDAGPWINQDQQEKINEATTKLIAAFAPTDLSLCEKDARIIATVLGLFTTLTEELLREFFSDDVVVKLKEYSDNIQLYFQLQDGEEENNS